MPGDAGAVSDVAVVTGASAGIGEATARRLVALGGVHVVLVARREDRLRALATELGTATVVAVDLTDADAPARVREAVAGAPGALRLLVNNAGARFNGSFAEAGWSNVERHLRVDLEAPLRLTEALLPALRATASTGARTSTGARAATAGATPGARPPRPVAIVNVGSTAARIARPGAGGYSAAKFALVGFSDALRAEEAPHGVHVGVVNPGFVATEGFPAAELLARPTTRWIVSRPERVAGAIVEVAGWESGRPRAERSVPRPYGLLAALRILAPGLIRRGVAGGAFTTATEPSAPDDR